MVESTILKEPTKTNCTVCSMEREAICICPECWRLIRKALKIRSRSCREDWKGWCYDSDLDLTTLVRLLEGDEEGRKIIR